MKKRWKIRIDGGWNDIVAPNGKIVWTDKWCQHQYLAVKNAKSFSTAIARQVIEEWLAIIECPDISLYEDDIKQYLDLIDAGEAGIRIEVVE